MTGYRALRWHWRGTDPPGMFANNRAVAAVTGWPRHSSRRGRRRSSPWLNIWRFRRFDHVIGCHGRASFAGAPLAIYCVEAKRGRARKVRQTNSLVPRMS